MNFKHIASTAIAAASIITTPLPSFAINNPPYVVIVDIVTTSLCMYRNGHFASTEEAAEEAWDFLISKGYTSRQISNITVRYKHLIKKKVNREYCAAVEDYYHEVKPTKAGSWS